MNPFRLHLPSVHLLTVPLSAFRSSLPSSRSLPGFAPTWEKCLMGTMICLGESGKEEVLWGESGFFFSYGGAPCWLSLLVFPAVRVGKQTAPAAFITSMVPGAFWKWHKEGRQLYNLQLLPNEMSVGGIRTNSRVWFWPDAWLWIVTLCKTKYISCVGNLSYFEIQAILMTVT